MRTVDLNRRKTWRQSAAGHDMLGSDRVCRVVEINEIAGHDIDRTDTEARLARVDAVEIHQTLERPLERRRIIIAGCFHRSGGLQPGDGKTRCEKAGDATHQGKSG